MMQITQGHGGSGAIEDGFVGSIIFFDECAEYGELR